MGNFSELSVLYRVRCLIVSFIMSFFLRYQILMSKQLIQEELDTWNSISGNSCRVLWKDAVPEINKQFMRISRSTTRSLSGKVVNFFIFP